VAVFGRENLQEGGLTVFPERWNPVLPDPPQAERFGFIPATKPSRLRNRCIVISLWSARIRRDSATKVS
jgi:hypothetical protein